MTSEKSRATEARLAALINGSPWVTVSTLQNSWTAVQCRYKMLPWNLLAIQFAMTHAAITGNSQVYTLPFGLASNPILDLDFVQATNWSAGGAENPQVRFDGSGNVTLTNLPAGTVAAQFIKIVPID